MQYNRARPIEFLFALISDNDRRIRSGYERNYFLEGISIVSLRNEVSDVLRQCLIKRGAILILRRNYGSRRLFARIPPGAMLRRPFRYRHSFMYAAVSDISYIAESIASWEKESGSVAKLWFFQYPVRLLRNIDSNVNKYFELKNSWGCRPNSNYLLSSVAS